MIILVINSGSSSIKFQLIEMPSKKVIASGMIDRIGLDNSKIKYRTDDTDFQDQATISDHEEGLQRVADLLLDENNGVLEDPSSISAVGHRVVHGGDRFSKTTRIDDKVKATIRELSSLAPLHNPHNYKGIEVSERIFPGAIQVAVFDTAFHQTIPEVAFRYAIPDELYTKEQIRLYGFHGTSHKYVSEEARAYLGEKSDRLISVHLGNGCSITAIREGKSIDHSLGFGPMNGLIMGTRSGDIDQSVIFHMIEELGYSPQEVKKVLQKESGMLGLTGYSDLREIEDRAEQGDAKNRMALLMNAYRVKKFIGAYIASLNGLDALIFTAGIGENSPIMRELICSDLDGLGIHLDPEYNVLRQPGIREIQRKGSEIKILVIPTDEEVEIAKQSYQLISEQ